MNFKVASEETSIPPETPTKRAKLWQHYKQSVPGSPVENELVEHYLPLVKTVVGRLAMTLPPHVDMEMMYSAGLVGLLSAVRQFEPKMQVPFESYARLRIRGAALDELRRMDWVPRTVHAKARRIAATLQSLQEANGNAPSDEEMAAALNIPLATYEDWLDEVRPATFVSIDGPVSHSMDDGSGQHGAIADDKQESPLDSVSRRELTQLITERLQQLPEMQRKVLALYYFEDLRLREIAEVFGLTESRICQIHAKAILSIRASLHKLEDITPSATPRAA
jgi:RNA polymerase sigma factor FliA